MASATTVSGAATTAATASLPNGRKKAMMNKSAIDWCDFTWNPVTGCPKGCHYCYARRQARRFCGDVRLNLASGQITLVERAR